MSYGFTLHSDTGDILIDGEYWNHVRGQWIEVNNPPDAPTVSNRDPWTPYLDYNYGNYATVFVEVPQGRYFKEDAPVALVRSYSCFVSGYTHWFYTDGSVRGFYFQTIRPHADSSINISFDIRFLEPPRYGVDFGVTHGMQLFSSGGGLVFDSRFSYSYITDIIPFTHPVDQNDVITLNHGYVNPWVFTGNLRSYWYNGASGEWFPVLGAMHDGASTKIQMTPKGSSYGSDHEYESSQSLILFTD